MLKSGNGKSSDLSAEQAGRKISIYFKGEVCCDDCGRSEKSIIVSLLNPDGSIETSRVLCSRCVMHFLSIVGLIDFLRDGLKNMPAAERDKMLQLLEKTFTNISKHTSSPFSINKKRPSSKPSKTKAPKPPKKKS